jgi:2-oxo-3-hexenedioate decarboxylase
VHAPIWGPVWDSTARLLDGSEAEVSLAGLFALHGRLFVGPRVALHDWPTLADDLAALRVQLCRDGEPVDEGVGAIVLDGPLNALRLWVDAMAVYTPGWKIEAGDCVTTGTITDAWPLLPGQCWTTRLSTDRLSSLQLTTKD